MHITDGVLATPVLVVGSVAAAGGVAMGLRRLDPEDIPKVALLTSALFIASAVRLPLGPTSTHLALHGLAGLVLGWTVFPALLVGMTLQAVLFGHGGWSVLGVNTLNLALPAVLVRFGFLGQVQGNDPRRAFLAGFGLGALAILLTALLLGGELYWTGKELRPFAGWILLAHLPLMGVEGLVTGSVVAFLHRVRPELLAGINP